MGVEKLQPHGRCALIGELRDLWTSMIMMSHVVHEIQCHKNNNKAV